jgi:hypothetical protein
MKYIKIIFAFLILAGLAYLIYSGPRPQMPAEDINGGRVMAPQTLSVPVGATVEALGLTLTLDAVKNDYRCPIDVECIEAGAVNTNITLSDGEEEFKTFYSSDGIPLNWNGYNISIVTVAPDLYSNKTIDPSDYVVTFHVGSALSGIVDNPDYQGGGAGGTVPAGENPCSAIGGTWDEVNGECLGIGANACQEIGGTFNECASACRNDPMAEVCTMQCVQVCEIK